MKSKILLIAALVATAFAKSKVLNLSKPKATVE